LKTIRYGQAMVALLIVAALFALSSAANAQTAPDYAAIAAAPDRSDADRQIDKERPPEKILAFTGVKPGMRVLDVFGTFGYKAELLARAVGPTGKVYVQNSDGAMSRIGDKLAARLKNPADANVVSVVTPFDDPAPPEARNLDLITFLYARHDVTYLGVDRAKMDKAMFAALKPGGILVIGDYAAKDGSGTSDVSKLHRSDEALTRSEIEAAGFKFVEEGNFLRHPEDPRTAHSHSMSDADVYFLKFQKPG
jgi:predicted methyltransferase